MLARKAAGIAWRESVGGWLCAVAHRLAMNARADASRHRRRETPFATLGPAGGGPEGEGRLPEKYHPLADPLVEIERRDLRQVLDDELLHLPEKYRAPVVLCDLEGRTHQEAAAGARLAVGLDLSPPGAGAGAPAPAACPPRRHPGDRPRGRRPCRLLGLQGHSPRRSRCHDGPSAHDFAQAELRTTALASRTLVARFTREQSSADLAQIITRARQAAQVATEIETHDPGKNRDEWRDYAGEMRRSAEQLAQTTQENNQLAMLAAAHRLDASCLKCHEVFRQ